MLVQAFYLFNSFSLLWNRRGAPRDHQCFFGFFFLFFFIFFWHRLSFLNTEALFCQIIRSSLNGAAFFPERAFTLVAKTNKRLHARSSCLLDTDLGGNEKESAVRAVRSPQGHWSPSALQSRTWNTCGAPLHPGASTPVSHCLSTLRSRQQTRASQVEPLLGPHAWKVLASAFLGILPLFLPRI